MNTLNIEDDLGEIPPVTLHQLPPPPPQKIIDPTVIEIIENDDTEIETIITTDEVNQDTPIVAINTLYFDEPEEEDEIIFIKVEDKPVFPGCENASDKYICFQEMMQKHIRKNFRYPETAIDIGAQGRVSVMFTIQKDGSIGDIKMRGPHKILEKEASRIIGTLPKMTPGKQRGKAVKVPFAIPINFQLQ